MSLKQVSTEFWEDEQVVNNFTPEDKLFYLWCLTNKHLNISGCFKISIPQIKTELGYNEQSVQLLLDRFEHKHMLIKYDNLTNELLLLNFYKYNWTQSPSIKMAIEKISIKNEIFKNYINMRMKQIYIDTNAQQKPKQQIMAKPQNKTNYTEIIAQVIEYLNIKLNAKYSNKARNNISYIRARLNEGFKLEDFKTVIDFKYNEWFTNDTMRPYLRPSTLFGGKFDNYLQNAKLNITTQKTHGDINYEYAN